MDKKIHCRDMGIDCDLMVCGKTEDEVLSKAGQHVLTVHGIEGFSKEFYNKDPNQMIREKLILPSQERPLLYSQYRYQTVLHSKNLGYFHLTV